MAVLPISTVPLCTASRTCRPGTISPAANGWIWKRLSVMSAMCLQKYSHPPHSVSSDLGQLAASRHLISGADCAMAGAASDAAAPTPPAPAVLMKLRLVTWLISLPPGAVANSFRLETRPPTHGRRLSLRPALTWVHADCCGLTGKWPPRRHAPDPSFPR